MENDLTQISLSTDFILELETSILKDDLYEFVREAWHIVEPDVSFVDGWHIRAICDYLMALYEGRIPNNKLIINIPPRHMKSLLANVFFVAWAWTKKPSLKFLCTSYGEDLAVRDSIKCKKLIQSEWYQARFDIPLSSVPDTTAKWGNIFGGYRYSFGFGGAITGQGGDYILIDDPLKSTESDSDLIRKKVNDDFDQAIFNRLNDAKTGKIVLIMQRLHEIDLVGHIQVEKKMAWEHLILPAEYEGEVFTSSIGFKDPRTETAELLWAEKFGRKEIDDLKVVLSERGVSGQLQQRPAPAGGFIFKRQWFARVHREHSVVGVFHSWDTAQSIEPDAAYSCGIVAELTADWRLYIREVVRKRLLFPQLQEEIQTLAEKYQNVLSGVIIENKSSGIQAVQTLRQSSPQWLAEIIIPFNPKGDKDARQYQAAKYCEMGCVLLPFPSEEVVWLKDFEDEIFTTPSSAYRDQADAFAQLVIYLRRYLSDGWRARTGNKLIVPTIEGVL